MTCRLRFPTFAPETTNPQVDQTCPTQGHQGQNRRNAIVKPATPNTNAVAGRAHASASTPSAVGTSSSSPSRAETIDSFKRLCAGEADDLPESAFMYVGTLDDARAKAEKMAAAG